MNSVFARFGRGIIGAVVTVFSAIAFPTLAVYGLKMAMEEDGSVISNDRAMWILVGALSFVLSVMVCPPMVICGLDFMMGRELEVMTICDA